MGGPFICTPEGKFGPPLPGSGGPPGGMALGPLVIGGGGSGSDPMEGGAGLGGAPGGSP